MIPAEAEVPAIAEALAAWIGRGSRRPLEPIDDGIIRRYIGATGDDNPLWRDDAFARAHGFVGRLIPPLLVGWEPFDVREAHADISFYTPRLTSQVPFPADFTDRRAGGMQIKWMRPVTYGEALAIAFQIEDIRYHAGRSGLSLHVTWFETIVDASDASVCTRLQT